MKIAAFYENIVDGIRATGKDLASVLAELREAGMELLVLSPESWKRDRKNLGPLLEKLGIGIEGMHVFVDFPHDPETEVYREMVDLCVEAGGGSLLIVPGMLGSHTCRDLDAMVAGMRKAVAYGGCCGLPVLMEDYDGHFAPYNSMAGLRYFLEQIPELGFAFDTGNFVTFMEDELEALELFRDRIVTVHLKDRIRERQHGGDAAYICADGSEIFTCRTGAGQIRIRETLCRLRDKGVNGTVELYGVDAACLLQDLLASVRWVREQLQK